jgi:restriction endonuclease S subunit
MAIASVKSLSQLEGQKRIDAEYYQLEYDLIRHKLNEIETRRVKELSTSVVSFGAYSLCNYIEWREDGVPYLNVENIRDGYIDFEEVKHIDENVNEVLKKSQVREGQVILTMAGTIGNAAVAYKLPGKVNSNQATAKITLKPNVSPFFLAAFLNSYFGRKQTEWEIVTSVQPNIFLWQIENIRVPLVPQELEREIEALYREGLDKLDSSKSFYSQAENLLLKELGLKDFKPKYGLSFSANLSKAFGAHRVDAEYFQPSYEDLVTKLSETVEVKPLKYFLLDIKRGIEVGAEQYVETGKLFIRVSNLSTNGLVDRDQKYVNEKLYRDLSKDFEPKVGELLLTKDATPGVAYVLEEPVEGIISSGILRLTIDETAIDKEYLALCINSVIGKLQIERDGGGSVITHWKSEQIKRLKIPVLLSKTQQEIASLICQSHEARKKAKELLEEAKSKVENLIEGRA